MSIQNLSNRYVLMGENVWQLLIFLVFAKILQKLLIISENCGILIFVKKFNLYKEVKYDLQQEIS